METSAVDDAIKRLRRIEGQVGGLVHMIEAGQDCEDVLTQLATASKALDRVRFKLVVLSGMRTCLDVQADGTMYSGLTPVW